MAHEPNPIKIVAWLIVAKKLIKFANDEVSYKVSDNVMAKSNFDKFPLNKGDKVEVGIQEGVVTFLRKQKSESKGCGSEEAYEPTPEEEAGTVKQEEPKPTVPAPAPKVAEPEVKKETPIVDGETVVTIYAISADKKVIKFVENKEMGWFKTSEEMRKQDFPSLGIIPKNKVRITYKTGEDGKPELITVAKVASEPVEQPKTTTSSPDNTKSEPTPVKAAEAPKKEWKPYSQNPDVQKSIECQACINSASNLVGMVAAAITNSSRKVDKDGNTTTNAPTANVISSMVKAIAEANYQLLQELKSK